STLADFRASARELESADCKRNTGIGLAGASGLAAEHLSSTNGVSQRAIKFAAKSRELAPVGISARPFTAFPGGRTSKMRELPFRNGVKTTARCGLSRRAKAKLGRRQNGNVRNDHCQPKDNDPRRSTIMPGLMAEWPVKRPRRNKLLLIANGPK